MQFTNSGTGANPYSTHTFYFHIGVLEPPPQPPAIPESIEEIERELDIIRGAVPTPEGYVVNKAKAKVLMRRLAELRRGA
jgi:hypothetical protein